MIEIMMNLLKLLIFYNNHFVNILGFLAIGKIIKKVSICFFSYNISLLLKKNSLLKISF